MRNEEIEARKPMAGGCDIFGLSVQPSAIWIMHDES
jgi:hypothetical protein